MSDDRFIDLAADIVCAYVSNNPLPASELAGLLAGVHGALVAIDSGTAAAPAEPEIQKPSPAEIRKALTPNGIRSFIDGKIYKTLKRHIGVHGHTPESYRRTYGLPVDFPMVAPAYAAQRSELAKSIGLGKPGGQAARANLQAVA